MHDLGTVRIFEVGGVLEVYFGRGDTHTRDLVKSLKGRFDGSRKSWRIDPKYARRSTEEIVEHMTEELLAQAPGPWRNALPTLRSLAPTTRRFAISFGAGGVRLEFPSGHKHEYTLKKTSVRVEPDGRSWLVPAASCADPAIKAVIKDAIADDQTALARHLDYLENFVISGDLSLVEGERESLGLTPGGIAFADPSFVRKVDPGIPPEPLHEYPLRVLSLEPSGDVVKARLGFVVGTDAWNALRARLNPTRPRAPALDMRHVSGKWSRRREY